MDPLTARLGWLHGAAHQNRLLVGIIVFAVVLLALALGNWLWSGLIFAMMVQGFFELRGLFAYGKVKPTRVSFIPTALVLVILASLGKTVLFLPAITLTVMLLFFTSIFRSPRLNMGDIGASLFTLLYLGFMLAHFILLRGLPNENGLPYPTWFFEQQGFWLVLWTILVVAFGDIGGYYVGKLLGRHLLYPELSPKKTREGAIGSLAFGVTAGMLLGYLPGIPLPHRFILSTLLVVVGALGDLVESQMKREAGVKDSGRLLQEHGGLLDRIDSYIFAGAAAYYYVHWILRKDGLAQLFLS